MKRSRQERLAAYLERITRDRGGLAEVPPVEPGRPGLETVGAPGGVTEEQVATANAGLEKLRDHRALSHSELALAEAIILPRERPAVDIVDGDFFVAHELWRHLNDEAEGGVHARLRAAIPAIGRIELPGQTRIPYGGTGFLVGDGLLMTNRHVAELFARGLGTRHLRFRTGRRAAIDFRRENDSAATDVLRVTGVQMIHPYWDMALLRVDGAGRAALRLSLDDARDFDEREIAVIGYPAYDPLRNDPDVQDELFRGDYGVKRLQPGRLDARRDVESFRKLVPAATHDCSTLGGNSGSAVIDLATGDVIALHFGGRYLDINYCVPSAALAQDARVVDAGVGFAGTPTRGGVPWQRFWSATETVAEDDMADDAPGAGDDDDMLAAPHAQEGGSVELTIPLHVTIRLGQPGGAAVAVAEAPGGLRLVEPWHDPDYGNREGYDPDFLGTPVPIPAARDPEAVAPTKAGGDTLDYQNFSLRMHARRRIALVTAANVTATAALKRPEAGRSYSRAALSGLRPREIEKWFADPRLDARFQLPDDFFTHDDQAFDKGHIVRRDDAAWGCSYDLLRRANGDTYHVTNCSPQVAAFNQSTRGVDNWGDLEDAVLPQAASERLCVLAGPILSPDDETFVGVGRQGGPPLRVKIPTAFFKVVVAEAADGLSAFGFVVEQDLSDVPLEFAVPAAFRTALVPIAEIGERAGLVFDDALLDADQFDESAGFDVALRAGAERVARAVEPELPTRNVGDDEEAEPGIDRRLPDTEAPIDWRVAKALLALRAQVNARFPNRSKASDGAIGDAVHATRNSDHNPWVRDGSRGVVTAIDITHDPARGCDAGQLAETVRLSRDPRIKYIISNRRIASALPKDGQPAWAWRRYTGSNPHNHHAHFSVVPEKAAYDSEAPWRI